MNVNKSDPLDRVIILADNALRTVFGRPASSRPSPANTVTARADDAEVNGPAAALMRINHTGEVCAQALYQGQALTARSDRVRVAMQEAAQEENDHLAWCEQRLTELRDRKSYLNPLFYAGSFVIGALSGALGDRWSMGFLAETERQVVRHLEGHLARLPEEDLKSRAVLEQMRQDEAKHATTAVKAGARELPGAVKQLMAGTAKLMTFSAARW